MPPFWTAIFSHPAWLFSILSTLEIRDGYGGPNEFFRSHQIYLVMKTGGGAKREGLGKGIHWHIVNQVYYYPGDALDQSIPLVSVVNDDGSITDYVDIESDLDVSRIDRSKLKEMDCITCHNRVTHLIHPPEESLDNALALYQKPLEWIPGM